MGQGKITIRVNSIFRIIVCICIVLIVFAIIFFCFENSTQSHIALREAKNVKMAIEMLDKECYARNECIYDENESLGLSKQSLQNVRELSNENSFIMLKDFDKKKRTVREFLYRNKRYEVTYYNDGKEETYNVKRKRNKED